MVIKLLKSEKSNSVSAAARGWAVQRTSLRRRCSVWKHQGEGQPSFDSGKKAPQLEMKPAGQREGVCGPRATSATVTSVERSALSNAPDPAVDFEIKDAPTSVGAVKRRGIKGQVRLREYANVSASEIGVST